MPAAVMALALIGLVTDGTDALQCDMSEYVALEGLEARAVGEELMIGWTGQEATDLRIVFGWEDRAPLLRTVSIRPRGEEWRRLATDLRPEFHVTSGVRRTAAELPWEDRWWVYWDAPLNVQGAPWIGEDMLDDGAWGGDVIRDPSEVERATASYDVTGCHVKTNGARLEVTFDGLSMGVFSGKLRFTVYRGTNLIRQEAIAATEEPSVAYKYRGGLTGFSLDEFHTLAWRDVGGNRQENRLGGAPNEGPVPLRARNRLVVAEGVSGSVAVFPPPSQFFFPRQLAVNLGFVWYRKDDSETFSMGVRHGDNHEGYDPRWIARIFPLYNAPPGTSQRMATFFYLSPDPAAPTRDAVLDFTHGDRYKPLDGYQVMASHFHPEHQAASGHRGPLSPREQVGEVWTRDTLDDQPSWIAALRALGVNIAQPLDGYFRGDEVGERRLEALSEYYEAARRHSDEDFLILTSEEQRMYLGGHWTALFPRPVYWLLHRDRGQAFAEEHPEYGTVYRVGSAEDMFELIQAESGVVWQNHPRTKGSTFYPDRIKDSDYFLSDYWIGGAYKAMPADLSHERLCEERCFDVLDDMNNWVDTTGTPKYLIGEVDQYRLSPEYSLYGDFVVNYVRMDSLPRFGEWEPILSALRAGDFFVTTGEVLVPEFSVETSGQNAQVIAEVQWTFPMEFVELVWGNDHGVDRQVVSLSNRPPFGSERLHIRFDGTGAHWVRLTAWDVAGNGAFTQPMRLRPHQ